MRRALAPSLAQFVVMDLLAAAPYRGYYPSSSAGAYPHPLLSTAILLLVSPAFASGAGRHPPPPVPTTPTLPPSPLHEFQNSIQSTLHTALNSIAIPTTSTLSATLQAATTRFFAAFSSAATTATFTETASGSDRGGVLAACVPGEAGSWVLPGSGCTAYYRCGAGRRPVDLRTCPAGRVFSSQYSDCHVPGAAWRCWEPVCAGRVDGLYPDLTTGCRRSVRCQGSRVVAAIGCPAGQLSAGWSGCRPAHEVSCPRVSEGSAPVPAPAMASAPAQPLMQSPVGHPSCWGRSPSVTQDRSASSRCRQYFRCSANGQRTLESCPANQVFDGTRCVDPSRYVCPGNPNSPCDRLSDGVHIQPGSRCRSYFRCALGYKSVFICSGSSVFDGERCVPPGQAVCSESTASLPVATQHSDPALCAGKSHGYFADHYSGCRRYAYCLTGARVATFTCEGGRRFDGTACVDIGYCPAGASASPVPTSSSTALLQRQQLQQGFVQDLQSGCRNYSFFIAGRETRLSCPAGLLFNGQLCVSSSTYTCPTGPTG